MQAFHLFRMAGKNAPMQFNSTEHRCHMKFPPPPKKFAPPPGEIWLGNRETSTKTKFLEFFLNIYS
jgi:hypothetical protein